MKPPRGWGYILRFASAFTISATSSIIWNHLVFGKPLSIIAKFLFQYHAFTVKCNTSKRGILQPSSLAESKAT